MFNILVISYASCARPVQYGPYRSSHNHTVHTTSGCDPDYGWIPGVDGTKCYMIIRVSITRVELALFFFIRTLTMPTATSPLVTTTTA